MRAPAPVLPDGGPRPRLGLVVLRVGAHASYGRLVEAHRGRATVAALGFALVFDVASGRLVSPRGHRLRWRLDTLRPPEAP